MKLLLWLALYLTLVQGIRRYVRDDNCLKRNRYKHESACRQYPRRYFYAFHRILSDCVEVTTNCPRMYWNNEFNSLEDCRDACYYFMSLYETTQAPNVTKTEEKEKKNSTQQAMAAPAPPPA